MPEQAKCYCDGCGNLLIPIIVLKINFDNNNITNKKELKYCFDCAELIWSYIEMRWPKLKLFDES